MTGKITSEPNQILAKSHNSPLPKSPMKYHYFDTVVGQKNKDLKKIKNKSQVTLAPGSAEKQAKLIQRNYSHISKAQRKLDPEFDADVTETLELEDATVTVEATAVTVEQRGKKRRFGEHEVSLKDGKRQRRLFPLDGTDCITMPGKEILRLITEYKGTDVATDLDFQAFVIKQTKQGND